LSAVCEERRAELLTGGFYKKLPRSGKTAQNPHAGLRTPRRCYRLLGPGSSLP
jgi:hypothetical protein